MGLLIVIGLIALMVIFVGLYNSLITMKHRVDNAWSQIEVKLQRKFDLIPNLIETVRGYAKHENEVLTKVAELRTSWANAGTVSEKLELNNELSGVLKTIMAVSENYPELKANQNFLDLQEELIETENSISYSRQFYNDTVTRYNTSLDVVPTNIIAGMFAAKFTRAELFKIEEEAKVKVKVDFN